MKSLYKKLHSLQAELEPIKKNAENPFYHSLYFDINSLIAAISPLLNKHGLIIIQPLSNVSGRPAITTIVVDIESGESLENTITLPEGLDAQKTGAAVTFMRRYSIQSLLLLEAVDDDGNGAVEQPKKPAPKPQATKLTDNDDPFLDVVDQFGGKEVTGKACNTCGSMFEVQPGKEWATQCFSCWKKANPIKK